MSLRWRLIFLLLTVYALGGWLITRWAIGQVRPRYFEAMEASMVETARLLAGVVETSPRLAPEGVVLLRATFENASREPYRARIFSLTTDRIQTRVLLADQSGLVLYDSEEELAGSNRLQWREIGRTLAGDYGARATYVRRPRFTRTDLYVENTGFKVEDIYVGAPVHRDGKIVGVVSISRPTDAIGRLIRSAEIKILFGMVAGGIALLGALLLAANWVISPLEALARWALAVRDQKSAKPPKIRSGTLAHLAGALVEMRDALEDRNAIESYTRSLAHEIKAPLSAIRGAAELLEERDLPAPERERFQTNLRDGIQRIERQVEELLVLSQLETGKQALVWEPLELAELVKDAVRDCAALFEFAQVELVPVLNSDYMKVRADRRLLTRALLNLLQNAAEFAPSGSVVTVKLRMEKQTGVLEVIDQGPGIPPYALERVFERFFSLPRPATQAKSTGLGLNLTREILELHQGMIQIENNPDCGVKATIRLPLMVS